MTTDTRQEGEPNFPKKRTLVIGATERIDFINAARLLKQYEQDTVKYQNRPGRHHGIGYGREKEYSAYVWHTANQITIYLTKEPKHEDKEI